MLQFRILLALGAMGASDAVLPYTASPLGSNIACSPGFRAGAMQDRCVEGDRCSGGGWESPPPPPAGAPPRASPPSQVCPPTSCYASEGGRSVCVRVLRQVVERARAAIAARVAVLRQAAAEMHAQLLLERRRRRRRLGDNHHKQHKKHHKKHRRKHHGPGRHHRRHKGVRLDPNVATVHRAGGAAGDPQWRRWYARHGASASVGMHVGVIVAIITMLGCLCACLCSGGCSCGDDGDEAAPGGAGGYELPVAYSQLAVADDFGGFDGSDVVVGEVVGEVVHSSAVVGLVPAGGCNHLPMAVASAVVPSAPAAGAAAPPPYDAAW